MPLYPNAVELIRANLTTIASGQKAKLISIGTLTKAQLEPMNEARRTRANPLPEISEEVVFIGQHVYNSRVRDDGYTIEDVIDQIVSGMSEESKFIPTSRSVAIQNHNARMDRYGSEVRDMVTFECTTRLPRPELFSTIPKGDNPPNPNAESLHKRRKGR